MRIESMDGSALTTISDAELLESLREHERVDNRRAARRNALVAELERRGLAREHGCKNTKTFLRQLLRITSGEAHHRVDAARALGPRIGLTGEALEPVFPLAAAAVEAGDISPAHARIIVRTVDKLPDPVAAEHAAAVEETLTGFSHDFDPDTVGHLGERVLAHLDPDGKEADARKQARRRDLTLRVRPDGSGILVGELDTACCQKLLAILDALAKPAPGVDGEPDRRSPGQRRHDGLHDACDRLLRTATLPASGGVPATVVITMSDEAWRTGHGLATTAHGAVLTAKQGIALAGGDHQLLVVAMNSLRGITATSSVARSFTPTQRLAMTARDRGCSFPGCQVPPAWCQSHHVHEWSKNGKTCTSNGTLLCGHHHREFERLGWSCQIEDGTPTWTPPSWIDPEQRPRTNTASHVELELS